MSGQEPAASQLAALMAEMARFREEVRRYRESPPVPPPLLAALWAPAGSEAVPVTVTAHGRALTILVTGGNPDPGAWLAIVAFTATGPPSHTTLHAALPEGVAAIVDGDVMTVSTKARQRDVRAGVAALLRGAAARPKLPGSLGHKTGLPGLGGL